MRPLEFPIESFLKESKKWAKKLKKLEEELENMSELPSVNNESGIKSSTPSDLTAQTAIRELKILAEMDEIRLDMEILKFALKSLTEDEKELVDGFFFSRVSNARFVYEYGRKHGLCKDYVYEKRREALQKMREIIEEEYYGDG